MDAPALRPTVTHKVRSFLREQGAALPPWSGLDETYRRLYELLGRRRDDPSFWEPLAQLLRDLVDDLLRPAPGRQLPAPEAELLASWDIDELLRELRQALPSAAQPADLGAVRRFGARISATAAAGFVLLGMVLGGCSGQPATEPEVPAGSPAGPAPSAAAVPSQPPAEPEPVAPPEPSCAGPATAELRRAIAQAALPEEQKQLLCACLEKLHDSWDEGLTALFETAEPETIAKALEGLVDCICPDESKQAGEYRADFLTAVCGAQAPAPVAGGDSPSPSGSGSAERRRPVPVAVPLYKGVTLPSPRALRGSGRRA